MQDIFGKDIQDYDIVSFPFVKHGSYMNSKTTVWLSYGIVKGNRVYLLDKDGKLIYKAPSTMLLLRPADLPQDAIENIEKIQMCMDLKFKK